MLQWTIAKFPEVKVRWPPDDAAMTATGERHTYTRMPWECDGRRRWLFAYRGMEPRMVLDQLLLGYRSTHQTSGEHK